MRLDDLAIGGRVTIEPPAALVRRPGPRLAEGLVTHQPRIAIDLELAIRQWEAYVSALSDAGWTIVEVDPADDCPDAVFVEDALVVFDRLAVVTHPGAESRRAETVAADQSARLLGLDVVRIESPGTLDGGDVLKVGRTAFVGLTDRTDSNGVAQLAALIADSGWTVRPVPVRRVLHLKSAVTALPDGAVIGHRDLVDDVTAFDRFVAVPEPSGAHVVLLGDDTLLMASDAPQSASLFRSMGYRTVEIDISEFEKLDGCVTCLSVRVRTPARSALSSR